MAGFGASSAFRPPLVLPLSRSRSREQAALTSAAEEQSFLPFGRWVPALALGSAPQKAALLAAAALRQALRGSLDNGIFFIQARSNLCTTTDNLSSFAHFKDPIAAQKPLLPCACALLASALACSSLLSALLPLTLHDLHLISVFLAQPQLDKGSSKLAVIGAQSSAILTLKKASRAL